MAILLINTGQSKKCAAISQKWSSNQSNGFIGQHASAQQRSDSFSNFLPHKHGSLCGLPHVWGASAHNSSNAGGINSPLSYIHIYVWSFSRFVYQSEVTVKASILSGLKQPWEIHSILPPPIVRLPTVFLDVDDGVLSSPKNSEFISPLDQKKEQWGSHTWVYFTLLFQRQFGTFTFTFTFSHLADAFVQSDVQGREYSSYEQ